MAAVSRRGFLRTSAATAVAGAAFAATGAAGETKEDGVVFECGVGVRDVTPGPGVPMWGYSNRTEPATGTLDPLKARAIVLRADKTVAIVTMDLGRVPPVPLLDEIRAKAKAFGVDHVLFTASHTHGGPVMELGELPHVKAIAGKLLECVEEAAASLTPARVGFGTTTIDVSHNRRIITEDGRCLMLWRNAERKPTSPVDHEAAVVRIDTAEGKPLAVVVHYACHPVVLGPDNRQYSADYAGEMARIVTEETGAECLFLQGGAGDINPYLDKTPLDEGGIESMRSVGRTCAEEVIKAWNRIEARAPENPMLAYSEKMVEVGTRWDYQDPQQQEVFRQVYGRIFDAYITRLTPNLAVPLSVLVMNNDIGLAFMPGELFVQYQIDLKAGSPLKRSLLVGYSNDFHIYFPTIKDAAAGGYGATVATYVGLGAGDKLVMESQIEIGRLTNKLRPRATPEDFVLVDA